MVQNLYLFPKRYTDKFFDLTCRQGNKPNGKIDPFDSRHQKLVAQPDKPDIYIIHAATTKKFLVLCKVIHEFLICIVR